MFKLHWSILLVIPLIISFCLTFLYIKWAYKHSILDIPNERSSHLIPTPRGGGIAIIFAFYSGITVFYLNGQIEKNLFFALLPGLILAVVGLIDDISGLSPLLRFTAQILCSVTALYFLGGFNAFYNIDLIWIWSIVALFGFVWFINLFNFLDGSDGYASMEAISITLGIWYFTRIDVLLLLAFSVGGFLYWNWPKAKIFLGDSGSTTLGFILVVFGLHLHNNGTLNFFFWILITALFWFDATVTLFLRIQNKEHLWMAHNNHIYQRAILGGLSHLSVLISGLAINFLLFVTCLLIWKKIISYFQGFLIVLLILLFSMIYVGQKFAFRK